MNPAAAGVSKRNENRFIFEGHVVFSQTTLPYFYKARTDGVLKDKMIFLMNLARFAHPPEAENDGTRQSSIFYSGFSDIC